MELVKKLKVQISDLEEISNHIEAELHLNVTQTDALLDLFRDKIQSMVTEAFELGRDEGR